MRGYSAPTTAKNVVSRLLLRFLLYYTVAIPFGMMPRGNHMLPAVDLQSVGRIQAIFLLLALLGGVLTIAKPFLSVLAFVKGLYDTTLVRSFTALAKCGEIGIFSWNACFFLIMGTAFLFAFGAARAQHFSFFNNERDLKLLFSSAFGRYLVLALLCMAFALTVALLWPHLCLSLGIPLDPL
jgi:hypothetical protein